MKFWKSKTFAVGVIIVCSALLIGLSWMNRQQERRRLSQMRALQQQAAPYEQELREIQSELDKTSGRKQFPPTRIYPVRSPASGYLPRRTLSL